MTSFEHGSRTPEPFGGDDEEEFGAFLGGDESLGLFEQDFTKLRTELPPIRTRLVRYGVEGMRAVDDEKLLDLLCHLDAEQTLIDDLVFHTLLAKRKAFDSTALVVNFEDMFNLGNSYTNPYLIRTAHVEEIVPNLEVLGVSRLKAYKLSQRTIDPRLSPAIRRFGWLAGEPYMGELPELVSAEETELGRKLKFSELFQIAESEVKRQGVIHDRNESPVRYDESIGFMQEAYHLRKKLLDIAANVCVESFRSK